MKHSLSLPDLKGDAEKVNELGMSTEKEGRGDRVLEVG